MKKVNIKEIYMSTNIKSRKLSTVQMAYCAIFTVLTIVGAFIKIPIPVVPFTLQILFVYLAGIILGPELGAISILVYALLGLAGLPVFSKGGGIWYVFEPSFGYIIGFIVAAYLTGSIEKKARNNSIVRTVLACFAGLMVDYAIGMAYVYVIYNYVANTPIGLKALILNCFVLAVPGDIVLCFIAAYLAKKVKPMLPAIR